MRRRVGRPTRVVGLLFGLAIAAPVLTACFGAPSSPPPPPASPSYASQYCAPSTPSTPAAYQDAFDEMRRAGVEWAAADGGHPVTLPDNRTLWLYGDTFTLPGLQRVDIKAIPGGILTGDGNEWGASAFADASTSTVYVYANGPGRDRRVARVPVGQLTTGPWQFYNGGITGTDADWSTKADDARSLMFVGDDPAHLLPTGITEPWDSLNVVRDPGGAGYLAVGKLGEKLSDPLTSTEISKWTAAAPQGPWHYDGAVAQATVSAPQYTYGATTKSGNASIGLYSTNGGDIASNVFLYGVKFVPLA